ncbi:hypothetical protein DIURU_001955 [Diutina rugosa]|uniref:Protein BNI4 n=1 Tax=Diutina rugosa TaxID=5481 RepID=A0A642UU81_DIURU|nr:uncharacterized protein DIURU_001955 [Diutina rugosa]KAA8904374.1 hypothetical protein DIURU_001955 [Diutina rugosa]
MSDADDVVLDSAFYSAPAGEGHTSRRHAHNLRRQTVQTALVEHDDAIATSEMTVSPSMQQLERILQQKSKTSVHSLPPVAEPDTESAPGSASGSVSDGSRSPGSPSSASVHSARRSLTNSMASDPRRPRPLRQPSNAPSIPQYDPERVYDHNQASANSNKRFLKISEAESRAATRKTTPPPTKPNHTRSAPSVPTTQFSAPREIPLEFPVSQSSNASVSTDKPSQPRHTRSNSAFSFASVQLSKKHTNQTVSSQATGTTASTTKPGGRKRSSTLERLRFSSFGSSPSPQPAPTPPDSTAANSSKRIMSEQPKKRGFFRSLFKSRSKSSLVESHSLPDVSGMSDNSQSKRPLKRPAPSTQQPRADEAQKKKTVSPKSSLPRLNPLKMRPKSEIFSKSTPVKGYPEKVTVPKASTFNLNTSKIPNSSNSDSFTPPTASKPQPPGPSINTQEPVVAAPTVAKADTDNPEPKYQPMTLDPSRSRPQSPIDNSLRSLAPPASPPPHIFSPGSPIIGSVTDDSLLDDFDVSSASFEYRDDPPQKLSLARRTPEPESSSIGGDYRSLDHSPGHGFGSSPSPPLRSPTTRRHRPAANVANGGPSGRFSGKNTNASDENTAFLDVPQSGGGNPQFVAPFSRVTSTSSRVSRGSMESKKDALLGEALFPKSLNAQEVESIVSLERSRSMRSVRSNKRSSFVGYSGDSENITHIPGVSSPSQMVNNLPVKRSSSILKHSSSRRSIRSRQGSMPTPASAMSDARGSDEGDFSEFSDFMDIDNVSFNQSPIVTARASATSSPALIQVAGASPVPISADHLDAVLAQATQNTSAPPVPPALSIQAPLQAALQQAQQPHISFDDPSSPTDLSDVTEESGAHSPESGAVNKKGTAVLSSTSSRQDETPLPEPKVSPPISSGVVPSPPVAPMTSMAPLSPSSSVSSETSAAYSPILHTAVKMSPVIDGHLNNRPISMSFRSGGQGSSFSRANAFAGFAMQGSGSHQSFTMSLDESDYSVGGGFGSDSDDDVIAAPRAPAIVTPKSRVKSSPVNNKPVVHPAAPVAPSVASKSDSPRSFTSMFSRKLHKKQSQASMTSARMVIPEPPQPMPAVRFSSRIILYDTYNGEEYDRHPDTATCNQLTPALAQQIKEELNALKSQMEIHIESRCNTHFF